MKDWHKVNFNLLLGNDPGSRVAKFDNYYKKKLQFMVNN
jgi:hypothetical protein